MPSAGTALARATGGPWITSTRLKPVALHMPMMAFKLGDHQLLQSPFSSLVGKNSQTAWSSHPVMATASVSMMATSLVSDTTFLWRPMALGGGTAPPETTQRRRCRYVRDQSRQNHPHRLARLWVGLCLFTIGTLQM